MMTETYILPQAGPVRPLLQGSYSEKTEIETHGRSGLNLEVHNVEFAVKVKQARKVLVDKVCLKAQGGRITAILGPSGAGKSSLLDLIAGRKTPTDGYISLNGEKLLPDGMRSICSFVEQDDSLLGVLTVEETISYTLALHRPHFSKVDNHAQVDRVIKSLGLEGCRDQIIGTPIKRGISGGQRRRVSIACGAICSPKVLILDEPTSGLDSSTSREVMSALRNIATSLSTIIICSIHQPGYGTWEILDDCVLLGKGGCVHYSGSTSDLEEHVRLLGIPARPYILPIDDAMDLLNTDFGIASEDGGTGASEKADAEAMRRLWIARSTLHERADSEREDPGITGNLRESKGSIHDLVVMSRRTVVLSRRLALNYSRNILAYGIRFSMYGGMAVMMSVIWIRLGYEATTINDRLSVHFYGVAFLSFMSVAGIPAFLEERALYRKERANGLYTPLPFVLANTVVNIPFLFGCCVLFSVIAYWGIGLHPGAAAFFRYLGFLSLAIVAAESQSVLIAAALPIFVAALAVAAFLNGFWMSVGGYFIKYVSLPRFWQVSFHWMDYQTYAFALLSHSDLTGLVFNCRDGSCPYPSPTAPDTISGKDVLAALAMDDISYGKYAGILVAINIIYRIALYLVLRFF